MEQGAVREPGSGPSRQTISFVTRVGRLFGSPAEESASPNYCRGALTRLPGLPPAIVEWMGSLDGTGGVSSPRLFVRG